MPKKVEGAILKQEIPGRERNVLQDNTYKAGGRRAAPRPRGQSLGAKAFWIFYKCLTVVSALIVGGYLAFTMLVKPPEQAQMPNTPPDVSQGDVSLPSGIPAGSNSEEEPPKVEPLNRREDVYTILLAATDMEGIRTDTMMLLTYDIPNQKIGVVSIPRDTLTRRPSGKNPRLVYGSGSVKQRVEDISNMLGIPIDRYVKVDISGFIALVDYLGGVTFYVPCDMDYDDPFQDLSIHYKKGTQTLNGRQCMEVARFRKNNDGTGYSDVGRTETQQQLLLALAKKVLSWNSLTRVNGFVEIFNDYVSTNMGLDEMLYFASQAIYLDISEDVAMETLAGRGDAVYGKFSYCYELDGSAVVEAVNRLVNPYDRDMTLEDMDILKATGYMS